VAASIYGANGVNLAIGSLDSGGGKAFDFFGAVHVMEALDELFVDIWNRVKHGAEDNIRYRIETAFIGSFFAAKVKEAQASKLVSDDQAQRLTRLAIKAVETLFRNGAYTENMDEVRHVRASEILAPKAQLLEYKDEPHAENRREEIRETPKEILRETPREKTRELLREIAPEPISAYSAPSMSSPALNGSAYNDGDLGGLGGLGGLGSPGLNGSSQGNSAYGSSAYGSSASTGNPEQLYRPQGPNQGPNQAPNQASNLREYRDVKDSLKDLKDIFGKAQAQ
jgi:hypothetical protein